VQLERFNLCILFTYLFTYRRYLYLLLQ